eukprot:TRINITY_DN3709_c0_g1_i1.p1 TRINITY_DN3709_c0_g1~~TRINITY_DN3709_c0_g1_i1.p1  ORF type:complete len:124 (+),score=5.29 TRINITY_DN3709_c0_g1_i1:477-848(+)
MTFNFNNCQCSGFVARIASRKLGSLVRIQKICGRTSVTKGMMYNYRCEEIQLKYMNSCKVHPGWVVWRAGSILPGAGVTLRLHFTELSQDSTQYLICVLNTTRITSLLDQILVLAVLQQQRIE